MFSIIKSGGSQRFIQNTVRMISLASISLFHTSSEVAGLLKLKCLNFFQFKFYLFRNECEQLIVGLFNKNNSSSINDNT